MLSAIRRASRSLCRLLIGVLLFAQLAIAAYACPQLSSTGVGEGAAMERAGAATPAADMAAGCPEMGQADPDQPNLCIEQVHFGQQSDQTQTPTLPAILLTALYTLPLLPEPAPPPPSAAVTSGFLAAASPPHAILHCCFRI